MSGKLRSQSASDIPKWWLLTHVTPIASFLERKTSYSRGTSQPGFLLNKVIQNKKIYFLML